MSKYLLQINYTTEGAKGLVKEGGTARRNAAQKAIESLGGQLESMHFAFGDTDAYLIMDMPDNTSVAAITLTLATTGSISASTTVLLTPDDLDKAARMTPMYRPPGQ